MHHVCYPVLLEHTQRGGFVAQIHLLQGIFGMMRYFFQIQQMASIGKTIEINELFDFGLVNYAMNHVGADKASPASDKKFHY